MGGDTFHYPGCSSLAWGTSRELVLQEKVNIQSFSVVLAAGKSRRAFCYLLSIVSCSQAAQPRQIQQPQGWSLIPIPALVLAKSSLGISVGCTLGHQPKQNQHILHLALYPHTFPGAPTTPVPKRCSSFTAVTAGKGGI